MDMKRILLASICATMAPVVTVIGAEETGSVPSTEEIIKAFSSDQERGQMIKRLVQLLRGEDIDPNFRETVRNQVIDRLKGTLQYETVGNDLEAIRYRARLTLDVLAHVAANDLKNLIQENKALRDEKGFEKLVQQEVEARIQQLAGGVKARIAELQADMETLKQANAKKTAVVQNAPQPVDHVDNGIAKKKGRKTKNFGNLKF